MSLPVTPAQGLFDSAFAAALAQQVLNHLKPLLEAQQNPDGRGSIEPRLLSLEETATYIGRSVAAVRLLIHRGKLPVTKIDTKVQVDQLSLDKLIEACTHFEN